MTVLAQLDCDYRKNDKPPFKFLFYSKNQYISQRCANITSQWITVYITVKIMRCCKEVAILKSNTCGLSTAKSVYRNGQFCKKRRNNILLCWLFKIAKGSAFLQNKVTTPNAKSTARNILIYRGTARNKTVIAHR